MVQPLVDPTAGETRFVLLQVGQSYCSTRQSICQAQGSSRGIGWTRRNADKENGRGKLNVTCIDNEAIRRRKGRVESKRTWIEDEKSGNERKEGNAKEETRNRWLGQGWGRSHQTGVDGWRRRRRRRAGELVGWREETEYLSKSAVGG